MVLPPEVDTVEISFANPLMPRVTAHVNFPMSDMPIDEMPMNQLMQSETFLCDSRGEGGVHRAT